MTTNSSIDAGLWTLARTAVSRAFSSSLHCAIASIDPDGAPRVTPIGSLLLDEEPGHAFYFDVLNRRLAANVNERPDVMILALDSSAPRWGGALLSGSFAEPPAVQMRATVGHRRPARDVERNAFAEPVGGLIDTPGGRALWGNARHVRDVSIHGIDPVRLGTLLRIPA